MGAWVGAGAWFFWWAGLITGLQVGQALRCSSYLGMGSAVPAPMYLGTQPPYATKVLICIFSTIVIDWRVMKHAD